MKQRIVFSVTFFTAMAAIVIGIVSCNKTFDAPPAYIAPNIAANTTIMALKGKYDSLTLNTSSLIDTNIIITGTVIADDKSGNFYKNIVIQDSTGGISIQLSQTNLYTTYNIGKQVWIKCNGLYMGNYNNSLTLGAGPGLTSSGNPTMEGIPATNISQYVIAGTLVDNIKPTVITASQLTTTLTNPLVNTLIELDNYQFLAADTLRTYADSSLVSTTAGTFYPQLQCATTNTTLELYNSNFASFANLRVPSGNGALIGVFTVYNQYPEIEIRDTSDVKFYNARCGGGGVTPPPTGLPSGMVTIATLRAAYSGNGIKVNSSQQITGVVISDASQKDINKSTLIIQQGNSGISLYFVGGTVAYNLGDSVVLDISGDSLVSYPNPGGSLQITATSAQLSAAVATGVTVTPKIVTIDELNAGLMLALTDPGNLEYTLVEIQDATVSPAGTYYTKSVYPNLTDALGGKIELFTTSGATFATTTMPTTPMTWIGYGNLYKGFPEFSIRNLTDVF
jgi:hypothetical protein